MTQDIALSMGLSRPAGVLISSIFPKGPADRAGIRVGDIITAVNGREVNDPEALKFRIATRPIGDRAIVDFLRRGKIRRVNFPIEAPPRIPKPDRSALNGIHPLQGAIVANLSPALAGEIGMSPLTTGVVVLETRRSGAANRFGFRREDILLKINGEDIKSVTQLRMLVTREVERWAVSILRDGKIRSLVVER